MPKLVVHGALLTCSCGTTPAKLSVLPVEHTDGDDQPAATVDDYKPNVNIAPFGMCTTLANPQVASATSAAQGVLTPQPCVPATVAPWSPGAGIVTINEKKALSSDSKVSCNWSGSISVTDPVSTIDVD